MLFDALNHAYQTSKEIASLAIIVNAIDKNAENFYTHYDFLPLKAKKGCFYLPMKSIGKLFK